MANSTWTGLVDSNWNTAGNWTAGVPGGNDTATFAASAVVIVTNPGVTVGTISLTGVDTGLTITGSGSLSTSFLSSGITILFNATGQELMISCRIQGSNGLVVGGNPAATGTLTLSNNSNNFFGNLVSSYSGGPAITLVTAAAGSAGSSTVVMANTLLNMSSQAIANNISFTSGSIINCSLYSGTISLNPGSNFVCFNSQPLATVRIGTSSTFDLNGKANNAAAAIIYDGGTIANSTAYTNPLTILATRSYGILSTLGARFLVYGTLNLQAGTRSIQAGSVLYGGTISNGILNTPQNVDFQSGTVSADLTDSGVAGSVTKTTSGTLTLSGTCNYTGGTTVSAGTLIGTTTSLQGDITNNGIVRFNQAGNGTYSGILSGTGSVEKAGAGNVTLGGPNLFGGGTTISAGTLTAGNATCLGTGSVTLDAGTLNLSSLNVSNDLLINGGTVTNAGSLTGTVGAGSTITVLTSTFPSASGFAADGGTVNGAGADFSALPTTFTVQSGGLLTNAILNASNVTAEGGNISATLVTGTLTKTTPGTLALSGSNSHTQTDILEGAITGLAVDAFGSGPINAGVVAGAQVTVDFVGLPIANDILANNGIIINGGAFAGALTVPALGLAEVPAGNSLSGTADISPTGKLAIAGQHTGTVNNDGEIEIDNSTAADPPVNNYTGNCGSTYAVRAA